MSQSNYHRLNDLLVHSCNRVLRALLAAVIKRERPSGARTIGELIQRDRGNIATKRIVQQNIHLVLTWNNIVILDRWDLQLLCFFIRYVCPPNGVVHKDIDALKEIRNKICHTPDGLIDDFYYRVKCDEIKLINSRFLDIIGNAAFREALEEEIEEIDNGTRNIPEAADTLREWLGRDKLQRTPITSFSDEQQEILDCLRRALGRREFAHLHVPDAEVDIVVENADNIHQQDQVSETLVNILDPGLRSDPQLCNLIEAQFTAIKDKVHECFDYLLESGQVVVRATHGCVIITVRSNSFESLGNVWRKLVSAETEVIMSPLQEVLRKTFSERLTIKAVLPECAFLDVAEQLAQQIKDIDQDGSKEGHESRAQIPEIEKGMEKLSVQEKSLTDSISVINLKIKPKSLKDYERLHRKLSKDKMDTAFERITDVLQQELNAPKLIISANLRSSDLSAKPKELDVAFTCFNGTRLQLIREDVGTLVKEAIVVETTESFDFESSEMGKALLDACGEQIVKECHEKYPRGLQPGEIANIKGQKLLGGTQILLTCLPEYSEDIIHIMKQTFHKCLVTAVHHKMHSIAFTAVGTSSAKYPVDVVASALTETCISFDKEKKLGSIQDIAFVVPPADESGYLAFKKELQMPGIFELKPSGSKEIKPKQEFATRKQQQESLWKYPSKEFDPKKELEATPYSEEKYPSLRRKSFIGWNPLQDPSKEFDPKKELEATTYSEEKYPSLRRKSFIGWNPLQDPSKEFDPKKELEDTPYSEEKYPSLRIKSFIGWNPLQEKKPKLEFATRKQQQESRWKDPSKEFDPKKELEDTPYFEEKYPSLRRKSFIGWNPLQDPSKEFDPKKELEDTPYSEEKYPSLRIKSFIGWNPLQEKKPKLEFATRKQQQESRWKDPSKEFDPKKELEDTPYFEAKYPSLRRKSIIGWNPLQEKKPKLEFATRKQQQGSRWKDLLKEFDPEKELEDTPYSEEKYHSRRRKSFFLRNSFQGDDEKRLDLIDGDLENIKIDHMGHGIVVACSPSLKLIAGRSTESLLKAGGQGLQIQCNKKYPKGIKYGEVAEIEGENQLKNVRIYLVALAQWSRGEEQENGRILEDVVLKCLDNADDAQLRTLTFTPLGCGQMRWPKDIFIVCLLNVLGKKGPLFPIEFIQILVLYKDESTFRDLELILLDNQKLKVPYVVPVPEIRGGQQGEIFHVDPQKDFLKEATRIISAATGRIKITMQDDRNRRAINTRQFFKEFFKCVTSSKSGMFSSSGKGTNYIPVKNEDAKIKKMFFKVGKAMGLAWLSVEKVELPLAAYVVLYIQGRLHNGDSLNLGGVHDTALVQFLQKVNTCAHQAELDDILATDNEGYLRKYGMAPGRKIDLSKIAEVCRELLNSYLIDHRKDALEQMRKGVSYALEQMRKGVSSWHIFSFADSMIGKYAVSISVVWDLFKTKVDELSMADETEERVKMMMKSYVQSIEAEKHEVLKLLIFSVGDLLYYGGDLHICICYNTTNRKETLPISVPYVQVLKLPLGNETFEAFARSLNYAVPWHIPDLYSDLSFDRK